MLSYLLFLHLYVQEKALEEMTVHSHFSISTENLQSEYEHNHAHHAFTIMQPQNSWGWKSPLEVMSSSPALGGLPRA